VQNLLSICQTIIAFGALLSPFHAVPFSQACPKVEILLFGVQNSLDAENTTEQVAYTSHNHLMYFTAPTTPKCNTAVLNSDRWETTVETRTQRALTPKNNARSCQASFTAVSCVTERPCDYLRPSSVVE
jgi:hypothetical protein